MNKLLCALGILVMLSACGGDKGDKPTGATGLAGHELLSSLSDAEKSLYVKVVQGECDCAAKADFNKLKELDQQEQSSIDQYLTDLEAALNASDSAKVKTLVTNITAKTTQLSGERESLKAEMIKCQQELTDAITEQDDAMLRKISESIEIAMYAKVDSSMNDSERAAKINAISMDLMETACEHTAAYAKFLHEERDRKELELYEKEQKLLVQADSLGMRELVQ